MKEIDDSKVINKEDMLKNASKSVYLNNHIRTMHLIAEAYLIIVIFFTLTQFL